VFEGREISDFMMRTAGTRLGRYEIRSHLGAGGMGEWNSVVNSK